MTTTKTPNIFERAAVLVALFMVAFGILEIISVAWRYIIRPFIARPLHIVWLMVKFVVTGR
jgi:hypothetical protein